MRPLYRFHDYLLIHSLPHPKCPGETPIPPLARVPDIGEYRGRGPRYKELEPSSRQLVSIVVGYHVHKYEMSRLFASLTCLTLREQPRRDRTTGVQVNVDPLCSSKTVDSMRFFNRDLGLNAAEDFSRRSAQLEGNVQEEVFTEHQLELYPAVAIAVTAFLRSFDPSEVLTSPTKGSRTARPGSGGWI